jgi:DME family drug/metabolite transporter
VLAGGGGDVSPPGVGLAVVAGAAYATYTLAAKRLLSRGHPPERVMAGAFGAGAVLLVPVLAIGDPGPLVGAGGLALVLFLGVVPTALAYVLFARGLRRLSAPETSTLTLAEPLTAGVLGAVVLAERLGTPSAIGAGLVLAGLLVLAVRAPRAPRRVLAAESGA